MTISETSSGRDYSTTSRWLDPNISQQQRKNTANNLLKNFPSFFYFSDNNNNPNATLETKLDLPNANDATEDDIQDINSLIYQNFSKKCENINITEYALEKAEYIVQRFKELREERGIFQNSEIAFQMLGEKGSSTIDDVIIELDQRVTGSLCEMTREDLTNKEIEARNKQVIAWGHSHTGFRVFYSDMDDETMRTFFDPKGFEISLFNDQKDSPKAKIFYGMVLNEAKDQRALRLLAKVPQYHVSETDGKREWSLTYKELDFETTPCRTRSEEILKFDTSENQFDEISYTENTNQIEDQESEQVPEDILSELKILYDDRGNINNWLEERIIPEKNRLSDEEKERIDNILLNRVYISIDGGYNALSQYKVINNSLTQQKPSRNREQIAGRDDLINFTQVQRRLEILGERDKARQNSIKRVQQVSGYLNDNFKKLQGIYSTLETRFNDLEERYAALETRYNTLERDYQSLISQQNQDQEI